MTDEQLIELYRSGDNGAMDTLIERYRSLVRARARSYYLVGGQQEDLIQEGMIGLFKAIRDYNPDKSPVFGSFARMCISRQLATALKLSNRSKHKPLNCYISFEQTLGDSGQPVQDKLTLPGGGPEEEIIGREAVAALTRHIGSVLSAMEKRVLLMYIQGLAYGEISKQTGYSKKSVDNALQRIKRKLTDKGISGEC